MCLSLRLVMDFSSWGAWKKKKHVAVLHNTIHIGNGNAIDAYRGFTNKM